MIFKVGDKVKIEGVLRESRGSLASVYPLEMDFNGFNGHLKMSFTLDGRYDADTKEPVLQLVERPKRVEVRTRQFWAISYKGDEVPTCFFTTEQKCQAEMDRLDKSVRPNYSMHECSMLVEVEVQDE